MKYLLILQWPTSSISDYDSMVEVEDQLIDQLPDDSEVDGHDFGAGEANIFIRTNTPERIFLSIQELLAKRGLLVHVRAAFREVGKDEYKIIWPKGLKEFAVS